MTNRRVFPNDWTWRRQNGQAQKHVIERIEDLPYEQALGELTERLADFSRTHEDATISLDHEQAYNEWESCAVYIELRGWKNISEQEVKDERKRRKELEKEHDLQREEMLRTRAEKLREELELIERQRGGLT